MDLSNTIAPDDMQRIGAAAFATPTSGSGLTLELLAKDIVGRLDKGDDFMVSAAVHLREAKERIEKGEAGAITFADWCRDNLKRKDGSARSLPEIQRQLGYAKSGDVAKIALALSVRREQKRKAQKRQREKKSGPRGPEKSPPPPPPHCDPPIAPPVTDEKSEREAASAAKAAAKRAREELEKDLHAKADAVISEEAQKKADAILGLHEDFSQQSTSKQNRELLRQWSAFLALLGQATPRARMLFLGQREPMPAYDDNGCAPGEADLPA